MKGYGEAAVIAAQIVAQSEDISPADAWSQATKRVFPSSLTLQNKGCPKGAFIGLCGKGLVKGIEPDKSARPSKNGGYAISAVEVLQSNRFLASQPELLWKKIVGNTKSHNHQLDVVISLWNAGLINID